MSSVGTGGDGDSVGLARRGWAARLGALWTRLVKRLDVFIPAPLRYGPPLELSRARMVVALSLSSLGGSLVFTGLLQLTPYAWSMGVPSALSGALFLGVLGLLRWRASPRLPGLVVCVFLWASILFTALSLDMLAMSTHAASVLVPVMAVYLLGWRLGLVLSVLCALTPLVFFPLATSQPGLSAMEWSMGIFTAIFITFGWAVTSLFLTFRTEAHATLEQARRTLHENEGELSSLIESTDDVVCSLDVEGRLLTANHSAKQYFQRIFGGDIPPGTFIFRDLPPERQVRWMERLERAREGHRLKEDVSLPALGDKGQMIDLELTVSPVWGEHGEVLKLTVFGRDVTERKAAEARLSELHRGLVDASRQAGMAEVATGVLHNVGNTLNSVNVSAGIVSERIRGLRVSSLEKAVQLLRENEARLNTFLTEDPRGKQLPVYLEALTTQLTQDKEAVLAELQALCDGVEHIRVVVGMQQQYARFSGVVEEVSLPELIDGAVRLQAASFGKAGIELRREYAPVPPVWVDRHKLLQILLNLLSNARHAVKESGRTDGCLTIRVVPAEAGRLCIIVSDNGVGIAPEHIPLLFTHGFTTKKDGHGFGLHTSALAAEELGGSLSCASVGRGQGATFTLELPIRKEEAREEGTAAR
ncbi:PAS domain S-box-containing protein [Archangium gephyra]|uniref:histidine kinase n=1 Tax=Archangium gephyra TaxID=48 RepID=A0ABX9JKC8_9BACT|nr:ATP-binding protein [Archangium gephyra]REG14244.1 PAS domain S-box-containing protein [Archangium gephyra]